MGGYYPVGARTRAAGDKRPSGWKRTRSDLKLKDAEPKPKTQRKPRKGTASTTTTGPCAKAAGSESVNVPKDVLARIFSSLEEVSATVESQKKLLKDLLAGGRDAPPKKLEDDDTATVAALPPPASSDSFRSEALPLPPRCEVEAPHPDDSEDFSWEQTASGEPGCKMQCGSCLEEHQTEEETTYYYSQPPQEMLTLMGKLPKHLAKSNFMEAIENKGMAGPIYLSSVQDEHIRSILSQLHKVLLAKVGEANCASFVEKLPSSDFDKCYPVLWWSGPRGKPDRRINHQRHDPEDLPDLEWTHPMTPGQLEFLGAEQCCRDICKKCASSCAFCPKCPLSVGSQEGLMLCCAVSTDITSLWELSGDTWDVAGAGGIFVFDPSQTFHGVVTPPCFDSATSTFLVVGFVPRSS
mmetsp:Transcript_79838/g.165960  ORF Transcript_79838/g.165960 Transcript_79838/m.165960 type:complete len:409 (-) Transcript_79838:138-1364(-)